MTTAERSPIVLSRFIAMRQRASVTMHVETHVAMVHTAGIPKKKIPAAVVGRSAIMTSSMILRTDEFACVCGDELSM